MTLVALSYVDIGVWSTENLTWIVPADSLVTIVFVAEVCYYLLVVPGGVRDKLLEVGRIIEFINVFELLWTVLDGPKSAPLIFMRAVRAARIKKVRSQTIKAKSFIKKYLA
jgi:hypothetical protein